jgi:hypothetical protein
VHVDLEREIRKARSAKPSRETERVLGELRKKLGKPVGEDSWVQVFAVRGRH